MRAHAREQSDAVLWKHVELYVTPETAQLSTAGLESIRRLTTRARSAGIAAPCDLTIATS